VAVPARNPGGGPRRGHRSPCHRPGGVFTLNAKHHPGAKIWVAGETFMVNGARHPYLRNSKYEADRAGRLLSHACGFPVQVAGIVVPVGAETLTIKDSPSGAHVVNRMALVSWLRKQPEVTNAEAVTRVAEVARRSTTWSRNPL
jgi:hypothetical protein